jgi:hypothetical protein
MATLETLRKYVRQEVDDPAPSRIPDADTQFVHDGGSNRTDYFQDSSENFSTHGVKVGDVIYNLTDGGSLAVIRAIQSGAGTNDRLFTDSIDGGQNNDYDNNDVIYIYDRYAQKGLDGTRFPDADYLDAINQAQKMVARKYGGVQKLDVPQDIKVQAKVTIDNVSGTFVVGETVTGGTNSYTAVVEYVASDFLVVEDHRDAAGDLDTTALFEDNEELTGGTSGATCDVNGTYTDNNFNIGQNLPTDLKYLIGAYYLRNNERYGLGKEHIQERMLASRSTGDPTRASVYPNQERIWLWPNSSSDQANAIHLVYWSWPTDLSADADETDLELRYERLLVLLASKIIAGRLKDEDMIKRILGDLAMEVADVDTARDPGPRHFREEIKWDLPATPHGSFMWS